MERIRASATDDIINVTAGGGGDYVPNDDNPGAGTDIQTPEERHLPVEQLRPDICTLDCGSLNFGDIVYLSPMPWLRRQARLIQDSGVKPELECFDFGHIRLAKQLIAEGLVDDPPFFQLCLGIPWGAEATTETMLTMRHMLPANAGFAAFGIGRMQMPMAAQSVLLGGHVRVGLEDNLYLDRGVYASNGQLVERAVRIVQSLGARVLTPAEARSTLGLKAPN